MRVTHAISVALRVGISLALLSAVAWSLVLLLPRVSDSEFAELQTRRREEVAKRKTGEFAFWTHQPEIVAARQIGPFGHRVVSLLTLATFPAVIAAKKQVLPALCLGLPLLEEESWRAFYLIVIYSALMWLTLGTLGTAAVLGVRNRIHRSARETVGAG
jgi:hypothetical protein